MMRRCIFASKFLPAVDQYRKHPILRLIGEGESQHLDFKFAVNDSVKIARSLVAFANTSGGTLLIGVKDNGVVAGVRTVEEYHMVEAAAAMYADPPVVFLSKEWNIGGRKVLEVKVPKSDQSPHLVIENGGKRQAYLRIGDSNVMANRLIKNYLKLRNRHKGGYLSFGDHEKKILGYLSENDSMTVETMKEVASISRPLAEKILVNLLLMDVVAFSWDGHQFVFRLNTVSMG